MKKQKKILVFTSIGILLTSLFLLGPIMMPNDSTPLDNDVSSAGPYNYAEALQKAIYFYLEQRSGDLPDDNPVIWRDDSALNDGADVGLDLTGGYYDAGDHVKFNLPMASTMLTLAWNVMEHESIIRNTGLYDELIDAIRWGTDYFIKCNPNPNDYYFQIGDGGADHAWWGPVEVIEEVMTRPSYKVTASSGGSTVTAATAAALIATSIILENEDPSYAATCLSHAEDLIALSEAAMSDSYYNSIAGAYYNSWSGFYDELATAKMLMYLKTGQSNWLAGAESAATNWNTQGQEPYWEYQWGLAWDDMHYIAQILLARETQDSIYIESIERNLDWWMPGGGITYSPGGQAHLTNWGSLRHSSNTAMIAAIWGNDPLCTSSKVSPYLDFAEVQTDYVLGSNPRSSSYLMGFGNNPPINPHHRTAHGSWANNLVGPPDDNRHILHGALVGGPPSADDQYTDDRGDYVSNEVAMDYNMGLVGALTYMAGQYGGSIIPGFPRVEDFKPVSERLPEFFANARLTSEGSTAMTVSVDLTNHAAWPAVSYDRMSFKYYFDISEMIAAGDSINDVSITRGYSEVPTVFSGPTLYGDNIYFIEVDYSGSAIFPGGQSESARETQLSFNFPSSWDSSNDFSYHFSGSTAAPNDYIPVFNAGVLIGGNDIGPAEPPTAPTGLSASAASWDSIDVDWNNNAEPNIAHYEVYRSTSSGFTPSSSTLIGQVSGSAFSDSALATETTYYYRVIAINTGDLSSDPSSQASATTLAYHAPPVAPTGLTATTVDKNSITLDWNNNPETDIGNYQVFRDGSLVAEPSGSSYTDTGLLPDTSYSYTITAVNTYGSGQVSDPCSPLSVSTDADLDAPAQPTGLTTTVISWQEIQLSWNANSESDLARYDIYRDGGKIAETTTTSYSDTGLTSETTYTYTIVAVDESENNSPASLAVSDTTPYRPPAYLRAQYLCGSTEISINQFKPVVNIYNDGTEAIPLSDVTYRYWFDSEHTITDMVCDIDYAAIGSSNLVKSFDNNGVSDYLEIGFTAGAGSLNPSSNTGEVQSRIHSSSYEMNDQSNDYSFDSTITSFTDYTKVTVYYMNTIVWGVEPPTGENVAPVVSSPADITYQVDDTTAYSISWTLTDSNPATYTITGPSGTSTPAAWVSGAVISEDVSGLTEGTHTYTITAFDDEGLSTSDSVDVFVMPIANVPPSVSSPGDITYQEGAIGTFSISWTLTDSNPATYTITSPSGTSTPVAWVSGAVITEDVSALNEGTHTYTITAEDDEGLSVSDSVDVIITPANLVGGDVSMQDITDIKVGDVFDTTIVVDTGVQLLAGYGFVISFDPVILQASAVVASATGFMAAVNIDNVAGTITVAGFDANGVGPTSALELIVISWEAIAEGESVIGIQVNELVDETTAVIGTPNGISNSIIVGPAFDLGDVNNDGKVDIVDALLVAQFYVGDPVSIDETLADVNLDGSITIVDALLIAQFYVGEIPALPPQ